MNFKFGVQRVRFKSLQNVARHRARVCSLEFGGSDLRMHIENAYTFPSPDACGAVRGYSISNYC